MALTALILVGCSDNPRLDNDRRFVGVINGRSLYRLTVDGSIAGTHYVYYFGDANEPQPTSTNFRSGKTSKVVVYIDGNPVSTNQVQLLENK